MVENPRTVRQGDSVALAIRQMAENSYRRLPVVDDDGRPVGLVDVEGIVHFLVQHFPKAVYNLPPSPTRLRESERGHRSSYVRFEVCISHEDAADRKTINRIFVIGVATPIGWNNWRGMLSLCKASGS